MYWDLSQVAGTEAEFVIRFTKPYVADSIDILDFISICGSMVYVLSGMISNPIDC